MLVSVVLVGEWHLCLWLGGSLQRLCVCVCVCVCSCLFMKFTRSVVCLGRGGIVERVWAHPWGVG